MLRIVNKNSIKINGKVDTAGYTLTVVIVCTSGQFDKLMWRGRKFLYTEGNGYCVDSIHILDLGMRVNPKLVCISHHHSFFSPSKICFLSLCCLCAVLPCLHSRVVCVFFLNYKQLCGATWLMAARVQFKQHFSCAVVNVWFLLVVKIEISISSYFI